MKETQILKILSPAHRDFIPILESIREKYGLKKNEVLQDFIWEFDENKLTAIRQDIEKQVRSNPDYLPPPLKPVFDVINRPDGEPLELKGLDDCPEEIKTWINQLYRFYIEPLIFVTENFYNVISNNLFEIILTGEAREIPDYWAGGVVTIEIAGNKTIIALASQAADLKTIVNNFREEYYRTFGKDRPNITKGNLNTAKYLRMKLENSPMKDIADEYIQDHRSEFPKDPESAKYKAAKRKLEVRLGKNMNRLQDTFDKIFGDKN